MFYGWIGLAITVVICIIVVIGNIVDPPDLLITPYGVIPIHRK